MEAEFRFERNVAFWWHPIFHHVEQEEVRRLAAELEDTNEQWLYMLTRCAVPGRCRSETDCL